MYEINIVSLSIFHIKFVFRNVQSALILPIKPALSFQKIYVNALVWIKCANKKKIWIQKNVRQTKYTAFDNRINLILQTGVVTQFDVIEDEK